VRESLRHCWTCVLVCSASVQPQASVSAQDAAGTDAAAQSPPPVEQSIAPEHHPWARFPLGAWRKVRVTEQTLDDGERIASQSVLFRVERLTKLAPEHFTLTQEIETELGSQRVLGPPRTVTLGLATDEPGHIQSIIAGTPQAIPLDGHDVEARVLDVTTSGEANSVRTRLWYAPSVPPYVLKSISEAVAPASQATVWRRSRKVLARGLPFDLHGPHVESTFFEEQLASDKGERQSILVSVDEVPGGIVARWTKETNTEGRLIRREVETLLDWGLAAEAPVSTAQPSEDESADAQSENPPVAESNEH
jgi:hypothetical protein